MMLAWMLLATIPTDLVLREEVACIEVNHHFGDDCRPIFTQILFHDFDPPSIVAWRLRKGEESIQERPAMVTWVDQDGTARQVRAACFIETWTQGNDKEIEQRDRLPQERRRGLRRK